jgi:2-C-methyl-D-erythritol 4-phosphate cytidylyltransferase
MNSTTAKQFLLLNDKPIIVHTLSAFYRAYPDIPTIVVIHKDWVEAWQAVQADFFSQQHYLTYVEGGKERSDSVFRGLRQLDELKESWGFANRYKVAIHDAVRPFVDESAIRKSYEMAQHGIGATCAVPMKNSIRQWVGENTVSVDRGNFVEVQTPQTFMFSDILSAYLSSNGRLFTDDAALFESCYPNGSIIIVDGGYDNIKITTAEDLPVAAQILKRRIQANI